MITADPVGMYFDSWWLNLLDKLLSLLLSIEFGSAACCGGDLTYFGLCLTKIDLWYDARPGDRIREGG
ncbi:hypothetical protein Nepgr_015783 [Nepenthes gracilis]|uniref:Uncharacterized protein n=1 Tax=Nepenthes gracilis TaxID=150966 RepID=A0AAD3SMN3_NEPGR|nr:hypothetical protein Nepgr_015783 [Nepenthes gracilis]